MRQLVESDMRFEHCYRIDEDRTTSVDAKRTCWREWSNRYADSQDHARMRYAHDRLVTLDDLERGVPLESSVASVVPASASPASAYEVPPSVAKPSAPEPASLAPRRSIEVCTDICTRAWRTCASECSGADACGGFCEDRYRSCLKGC